MSPVGVKRAGPERLMRRAVACAGSISQPPADAGGIVAGEGEAELAVGGPVYREGGRVEAERVAIRAGLAGEGDVAGVVGCGHRHFAFRAGRRRGAARARNRRRA